MLERDALKTSNNMWIICTFLINNAWTKRTESQGVTYTFKTCTYHCLYPKFICAWRLWIFSYNSYIWLCFMLESLDNLSHYCQFAHNCWASTGLIAPKYEDPCHILKVSWCNWQILFFLEIIIIVMWMCVWLTCNI